MTILVCVGIAFVIFLCAVRKRPTGEFSISNTLPDEVWTYDNSDYYIVKNEDSDTIKIEVSAYYKEGLGNYPRMKVTSSDDAVLSVEDVENGKSWRHDIRLKAKQAGVCFITVRCGIYSKSYRFIVMTQEKYEAKQEQDAISEAEIGDLVTYGHYEQDNDLENGSESIEWIVLDKKDYGVEMVSRYILDAMEYDDSGSTDWEDSDIRFWLNTDFYEEAFSEYEQDAMVILSVKTNGSDTEDCVFLNSTGNVNNYLDPERQCEATAYAEAQGLYVYNDGMSEWWLRNKNTLMDSVYFVSHDGEFSHTYPGNTKGVRPVIMVNP